MASEGDTMYPNSISSMKGPSILRIQQVGKCKESSGVTASCFAPLDDKVLVAVGTEVGLV